MRTQSAASPGSVQKSITAAGAAVRHGDSIPASPQHIRLVNPGRIAMVPSTVPVRQEIDDRTVSVSLVNRSRRRLLTIPPVFRIARF